MDFGLKNSDEKSRQHVKSASEHRTTCHRCGNIRKDVLTCSECPYIFCVRCVGKMKEEHGKDTFKKGCPVCKSLCCCSIKSNECHKKYHCYKKCPTTRNVDYVRPCALKQNTLRNRSSNQTKFNSSQVDNALSPQIRTIQSRGRNVSFSSNQLQSTQSRKPGDRNTCGIVSDNITAAYPLNETPLSQPISPISPFPFPMHSNSTVFHTKSLASQMQEPSQRNYGDWQSRMSHAATENCYTQYSLDNSAKSESYDTQKVVSFKDLGDDKQSDFITYRPEQNRNSGLDEDTQRSSNSSDSDDWLKAMVDADAARDVSLHDSCHLVLREVKCVGEDEEEPVDPDALPTCSADGQTNEPNGPTSDSDRIIDIDIDSDSEISEKKLSRNKKWDGPVDENNDERNISTNTYDSSVDSGNVSGDKFFSLSLRASLSRDASFSSVHSLNPDNLSMTSKGQQSRLQPGPGSTKMNHSFGSNQSEPLLDTSGIYCYSERLKTPFDSNELFSPLSQLFSSPSAEYLGQPYGFETSSSQSRTQSQSKAINNSYLLPDYRMECGKRDQETQTDIENVNETFLLGSELNLLFSPNLTSNTGPFYLQLVNLGQDQQLKLESLESLLRGNSDDVIEQQDSVGGAEYLINEELSEKFIEEKTTKVDRTAKNVAGMSSSSTVAMPLKEELTKMQRDTLAKRAASKNRLRRNHITAAASAEVIRQAQLRRGVSGKRSSKAALREDVFCAASVLANMNTSDLAHQQDRQSTYTAETNRQTKRPPTESSALPSSRASSKYSKIEGNSDESSHTMATRTKQMLNGINITPTNSAVTQAVITKGKARLAEFSGTDVEISSVGAIDRTDCAKNELSMCDSRQAKYIYEE